VAVAADVDVRDARRVRRAERRRRPARVHGQDLRDAAVVGVLVADRRLVQGLGAAPARRLERRDQRRRAREAAAEVQNLHDREEERQHVQRVVGEELGLRRPRVLLAAHDGVRAGLLVDPI